MSPPPELVPFRTPGGTLHTNGFLKTETLHKEIGSWLGTTTSGIRLDATYCYDIELRSKDWNILIDDTRHVAFVVTPGLQAQLPVNGRQLVHDFAECQHRQEEPSLKPALR